MQTRVKFAVLGRRWSRLNVISRGKNPRSTASGRHSRTRQLAITFGLVRRTWRSLDSLAFASLRVMYYSLLRSLVFAAKDTFTKRLTNASLRRFCCWFVYPRWWLCINSTKRQCNFLHSFTIHWRLKSDTIATCFTVHWRTLTFWCALLENRDIVKKKCSFWYREKDL